MQVIEPDVYCYRFTVRDPKRDGGWREEFIEDERDLEELHRALNAETLVMTTRLIIDRGPDGKRYIRSRQEKLYSPHFVLDVIEATPPAEEPGRGA